jgi:hypothetical protein
MILSILLWLGNPMTWLIAMMVMVGWSRMSQRVYKRPDISSRVVRAGAGSPEAFGAAFLFLSMAYRPNHAFIAKAQITQQEETDDDDEGGPDTPQKHLHRQLRRIRHGEKVDRLVWRLE